MGQRRVSTGCWATTRSHSARLSVGPAACGLPNSMLAGRSGFRRAGARCAASAARLHYRPRHHGVGHKGREPNRRWQLGVDTTRRGRRVRKASNSNTKSWTSAGSPSTAAGACRSPARSGRRRPQACRHRWRKLAGARQAGLRLAAGDDRARPERRGPRVSPEGAEHWRSGHHCLNAQAASTSAWAASVLIGPPASRRAAG